MARHEPYLGVSGITDRAHADAALAAFGRNHPARVLALGALASHKSVAKKPLNAPWDKRTAPAERLSELFVCDKRVMNCVHYAPGAASAAAILADLHYLALEVGLCLDCFQLNWAWPSLDILQALRTRRDLFPRAPRVILQVNETMLQSANDDFSEIARRLKRYETLAHYALFDASGGKGKALNVSRARAFLRACHAAELPFTLGVAGGLGPDTLAPFAELIREFPDISCDMEGGVRDDRNELSVPKMQTAIAELARLTR